MIPSPTDLRMPSDSPLLCRLAYRAAWIAVLAGAGYLWREQFLPALLIATILVLMLTFLVRRIPRLPEPGPGRRLLKLAYLSLMMGNALFWSSSIGLLVTSGSAQTVLSMFALMMLLPGAVLCFMAGLPIVEFLRFRRGDDH